MTLSEILTGGFAKGYRTYILMGLAIALAITNWAIGDATSMQTLTAVATALGIGTAAVHQP